MNIKALKEPSNKWITRQEGNASTESISVVKIVMIHSGADAETFVNRSKGDLELIPLSEHSWTLYLCQQGWYREQ